MTAEVLSHPALIFHEMLREAKGGGVGDALALFKFALENDISRTPVLELLKELRGKQERLLGETELEQFVRWCDSKKFIATAKTDEDVSSARAAQDPEHDVSQDGQPEIDDKRKQLFEGARKLRQTVGESHSELRSHKYWYFCPGYEVDSALWNGAFENDDPVLTIVWYLRSFFKMPSHENIEKQEIT